MLGGASGGPGPDRSPNLEPERGPTARLGPPGTNGSRGNTGPPNNRLVSGMLGLGRGMPRPPPPGLWGPRGPPPPGHPAWNNPPFPPPPARTKVDGGVVRESPGPPGFYPPPRGNRRDARESREQDGPIPYDSSPSAPPPWVTPGGGSGSSRGLVQQQQPRGTQATRNNVRMGGEAGDNGQGDAPSRGGGDGGGVSGRSEAGGGENRGGVDERQWRPPMGAVPWDNSGRGNALPLPQQQGAMWGSERRRGEDRMGPERGLQG